jgi:hypothetical protein
MLMIMVIAALLRTSYELSKPKPHNPYTGTDLNTITPQQKEWAEKATKRYAEVQDKKWRHWNEAMFEQVK